jgi:hypothetical protein
MLVRFVRHRHYAALALLSQPLSQSLAYQTPHRSDYRLGAPVRHTGKRLD